MSKVKRTYFTTTHTRYTEDWQDDYCEECKKDTLHDFHSECHERDSRGDYKKCTICDNYVSLG